MKQSQQLTVVTPYQPVVDMVIDSLTSEHSRRSYKRSISDFLGWYQSTEQTRLDRRVVMAYIASLRELPMSPQNINSRLVALRKLAREAALNDLLDEKLAQGIQMIKGETVGGRRIGNWLTLKEAQDLIEAPDVSTPKGLRDRAILATLIGTGLRREELTHLTLAHIQQREGRWAIVDIMGKRNKIRTIPMASWNKVMIDKWVRAAKPAPITEGCVFRAMNKGGECTAMTLSERAIHDIVAEHARAAGLVDDQGESLVAPHDLRRTFAKLAYKGGAPLDQISLSLGHDSIETTQRYLGIEQNFDVAPCDKLGLKLSA